MSKPWILVSPASRGIGLALTRYLLRKTEAPVVATYRKDADRTLSAIRTEIGDNVDLQRRLHLLPLDVTREDTFVAAANEVEKLFPTKEYHLGLGFAIPGILHVEKSPKDINCQKAYDTFAVNSIGPLMYIKHFHRFLPRKRTELRHTKGLHPNMAVMGFMSARVGSITDNRLGGWYSYRASKAAVTQLAKTFDHYLNMRAGDKAACVAMHPGTVRTDFSEEHRASYEQEGKTLSPDEAATKLVERVLEMDSSSRGLFHDWKGGFIPP